MSEVVQWLFLRDRDGDWHDAAADLVGVTVGWLVACRLLARR